MTMDKTFRSVVLQNCCLELLSLYFLSLEVLSSSLHSGFPLECLPHFILSTLLFLTPDPFLLENHSLNYYKVPTLVRT